MWVAHKERRGLSDKSVQARYQIQLQLSTAPTQTWCSIGKERLQWEINQVLYCWFHIFLLFRSTERAPTDYLHFHKKTADNLQLSINIVRTSEMTRNQVINLPHWHKFSEQILTGCAVSAGFYMFFSPSGWITLLYKK